MRILHLIDSGGLYGAERMLLTLMERQRDAGHEAVLLSAGEPDQPPKAIELEARNRGLELRDWRMKPRFNRTEAAHILDWIHQQRFDVMHSHGYKFNVLLGTFSKSRRRIPLVTTLHGYITGKPFERSWVYTQADKIILPGLDAVVMVSEGIRAKIPRLVSRKPTTRLIPNGIDLEAVRTQAGLDVPDEVANFCAAHEPVLIGVGRLAWEKAFDRVLRIGAALKEDHPSLGILIVGEGRARNELEALAKSLGVPVCMPGFSDRVPALMRRCDLLCMPSHTEGLPLTLLEAMTVGLPVAATPVGEIPAVLADGRGGVVLDPSDEDRMAEQVRALLADATSRDAAVAWSRERVETVYSSEVMSRSYEELYRSLVGR